MEENCIVKLLNVFRSKNNVLRPVENISNDEFQLVEKITSLFAAGSFYYFILKKN